MRRASVPAVEDPLETSGIDVGDCRHLWADVVLDAVNVLRVKGRREVLAHANGQKSLGGKEETYKRIHAETIEFFHPLQGGAPVICDACGFPFVEIVKRLVAEGHLPRQYLRMLDA